MCRAGSNGMVLVSLSFCVSQPFLFSMKQISGLLFSQNCKERKKLLDYIMIMMWKGPLAGNTRCQELPLAGSIPRTIHTSFSS